jgi:hypothetical protein
MTKRIQRKRAKGWQKKSRQLRSGFSRLCDMQFRMLSILPENEAVDDIKSEV